MENLNCPDCNNQTASKGEKARIAFLGGSINCLSCGAKLKAGGRLYSNIIGSVIGSLFLFVVIYALAIKSWLPVIATLIASWLTISITIYFSGFKRVGTKRFKI